jgi:uncharacterized protein (DUF362 family)
LGSRVWIFRPGELERAGWLQLPDSHWKTAVVKPNWVRDFNELDRGNPSLLDETVTSPNVILAVLAELQQRADRLVVADAPQFDTNWERLHERLDISGMVARAHARGIRVDVRDLRQEVVRTDANDVIVERQIKNGDPEGYRVVDLADLSAFAPSGFNSKSLRGSDYDAEITIRHHSDGKHEYCVAGTILNADLIVNVPKAKTHKKSGVTLCLKNLVGINGNKNYLPHHRAGRPEQGGDEFPGGGGNLYRRARAWAIDRARPLMKSSTLVSLIRPLRALDLRTRPAQLIRNGNWWGNNTIWRMILDLNRVLIYADRSGIIQRQPQRSVFHVIDGIVAGEGEGPMAPSRKNMGLLIASEDPVAADIATSALMGFDPFRIPVIRHACEEHPLPITRVAAGGGDLEIMFEGRVLHDWRELPNLGFRPHSGWAGHIERTDRPPDDAVARLLAS